jgi:hypothetical protein
MGNVNGSDKSLHSHGYLPYCLQITQSDFYGFKSHLSKIMIIYFAWKVMSLNISVISNTVLNSGNEWK